MTIFTHRLFVEVFRSLKLIHLFVADAEQKFGPVFRKIFFRVDEKKTFESDRRLVLVFHSIIGEGGEVKEVGYVVAC